MPKLRKAKDGHSYVQAFVYGAGHVGTWQITDEGVDYIRGLGFNEEEIPSWLFTDLREKGWAFTKGSGFGNQAPLDTLPAKGAERQLKLAIEETENGWVLSILVPELPPEVFAQLIGKTNQSHLTKCSLRIDSDKELLPISQLWPGKGGKSWPLDPHEGRYLLALVGPWPSIATFKFLTVPVDGLDPKGSIFFASDKLGMRVLRGSVVIADSTYYLVAKTNNDLQSPPSVCARLIGANNKWKAWEIHLPVNPTDDVRHWFAQYGMGIEEPNVILEIVTPPPKRILVTGVPLFEVEQEIVLSATPSNDKVGMDQFALSISCEGEVGTKIPHLRARRVGESAYIRFSVRRPGTYQIRAVKGRVAPLTFAVQLGSTSTVSYKLEFIPPPLSVKIGPQCYTAFSKDKECIDVWIGRSEKMPAFEIDCPVPLHLHWSSRGITEHSAGTSAETIDQLSSVVAEALAEHKPIALEFDAGSFGRLHFRISPVALKAAKNEAADYPEVILMRARWLAATIVSLRRRGEREIEIDSECQRSFRRLGALPGCDSLKEIAKVPLTVIHQATALGRAVIMSESSNKGLGVTNQKQP